MKLQSMLEKLNFLYFRMLLPIQKKTVLFQSFAGIYGDNPKFIAEKLHEEHPEYKILFVTSSESSGTDFPDWVKTVTRGSFAYFKSAATAEVLVDNMSGFRAFRQAEYKAYRNLFLTRKGQLNLSTWHGTPLKKIGIHEAAPNIRVYQTSAKSMATGNEYCYNLYQECFPGIPLERYGTPRNDIFFEEKAPACYKEQLGLPADKKVLLYAPTFRNNPEDSGLLQLRDLQWSALQESLSKRFGGDWVLVLRLHHEVLNVLHETFSDFVDGKSVFDGNAHDDMNTYLAASDALLTDYSSSFFDYSLTDRPVFLYAHDKEEYCNRERGLYMPLEDLPFTFAEDVPTLLSQVEQYNEETALQKRAEFLKTLGNFEDGNASARYAKEISEFLERHKHSI